VEVTNFRVDEVWELGAGFHLSVVMGYESEVLNEIDKDAQ
jgi:hypothetical protein